MSLVLRLELAAPGNQILMGNHQLFNGAPWGRYLSFMLYILATSVYVTYAISSIKICCIKHSTNSERANFLGTIACTKRGLKEWFRAKYYMVKLMNPLERSVGIEISQPHLAEYISVLKFYVEILAPLMKIMTLTMSKEDPGDLRNAYGDNATMGSAESRKTGVDRGFVVANTYWKISPLISRRNYSTKKIVKETSKHIEKEANSAGLEQLEKLFKDNLKDKKVNKNIMNIIKDPDILKVAYSKIKSKPGNMTRGNDSETLDGINSEYFENLSKLLGSGAFKFKPTRRIMIPKSKGGLRPLSIGSPREKIVQEAMRMVLEGIFEPHMNKFSHGFRPNRGCLTAIWDVRNYFGSVKWFVEVDITKCFDNIPHDIIIRELDKRIDDRKFKDLIYKLLRAGYVDENGTYHNTTIGVPQGSVVSPILSNIVLTLVDDFLTKYKEGFDKGIKPQVNPEYRKLSKKVERSKLFSERLKFTKLRAFIRPFMDDSNYRRMKFVRYADDILIGLIGSKKDAQKIREDLNEFLKSIGWELNLDKTLITHASLGVAKFLGYEIHITPVNKRPTVTKVFGGKERRSTNITRPIINAPIKAIILKLEANSYCKGGLTGNPTSCRKLIHEEHGTIIKHYLSIGRGLLNYYRIATNFTALKHRIHYILYYSCVLTLALKYKLGTKKAAIRKFGINLATFKEVKGNKVIDVSFPRDVFSKMKRISEHKEFKEISNINDPFEFIEKASNWLPRTKDRLEAPCSICKSKVDVEMHHVRKLRNSNIKKVDYLTERMIKMNRKQIPICKVCHHKLHSGKNYGPGL